MSQVNGPGVNEFNLSEPTRTTFESSVAKAKPTTVSQPVPAVPGPQQVIEAATQQELETTRQMLQYQQSLIESLTEQLASGHTYTSRLEGDLALVQQHYTEQSRLLQETETACLDLRARLYRQQRQTLQFKAALEQCLESSTLLNPSERNSSPLALSRPHLETRYTPSQYAVEQPLATLKTQESASSQDLKPMRLPLIFQEQPIQPWSAQLPRTGVADLCRQPVANPDATTQAVEDIQTSLQPPPSTDSSLAEPSPSIRQGTLPDITSPAAHPSLKREPSDTDPASGTTQCTPGPLASLTLEVSASARYPRRRKSLAAVELPSFPRYCR